MTSPTPVYLLRRYMVLQGGHQFTRASFLLWAVHHGLSRRTPCQVIDGAFAELHVAGELAIATDTPQALLPLYRRAA